MNYEGCSCLQCGNETLLARGCGILTYACSYCGFIWEVWEQHTPSNGVKQIHYEKDNLMIEVPIGCLAVFNGKEI